VLTRTAAISRRSSGDGDGMKSRHKSAEICTAVPEMEIVSDTARQAGSDAPSVIIRTAGASCWSSHRIRSPHGPVGSAAVHMNGS
jgi:hypothetical protein